MWLKKKGTDHKHKGILHNNYLSIIWSHRDKTKGETTHYLFSVKTCVSREAPIMSSNVRLNHQDPSKHGRCWTASAACLFMHSFVSAMRHTQIDVSGWNQLVMILRWIRAVRREKGTRADEFPYFTVTTKVSLKLQALGLNITRVFGGCNHQKLVTHLQWHHTYKEHSFLIIACQKFLSYLALQNSNRGK